MATSSSSELRKDAEELRSFLSAAQRQRVKDVLTVELRKLETEITQKLEVEVAQMEAEQKTLDGAGDNQNHSLKTAKSQNKKPTVDITNYAWDQSEKFMKIYATVPGVETVAKEQVTCSFHLRSFKLRCENVGEKNYTCEVNHLMEEIVPEESYFKIKSNTVLIMLKKKVSGKTWPYVTQTEKKIKDKDKPKPSIDKDADPNESLMSMMRQMYDEGDDEMKRTIAKAWTESREKQKTGDFSL